MSDWSEGPDCPDVIFIIPVNFVCLQRNWPTWTFGSRGPDSIRGPTENPQGASCMPPWVVGTSLLSEAEPPFMCVSPVFCLPFIFSSTLSLLSEEVSTLAFSVFLVRVFFFCNLGRW